MNPKKKLGNYSEIVVGDRIRKFVNKNKVNHLFFKNGIIDEKTAYIFGLLLTDGSVGKNKNGGYCVRIGLTDNDIIKKIASAMNYKNSISFYDKRKAYTINISSPYLYYDLSVLGCVSNKTHYASYPFIIDDLDRHFLRGVIDGDGSWWLKKGSLFLAICGNDLLLYGIYLKIKKHLNLTPQSLQYPRDWNTRYKRKMVSFAMIRYNTTDSVKIRDWLYEDATIYGIRKHQKAYSTVLPYTDRFSTKKLVSHLGVAKDFIKKNIKRDHLPHCNVGPYYYFEENQIKCWEEFLINRLKDVKCKLPNRVNLRDKWLSVI